MASFVATDKETYYVALKAEEGSELTTEQAAAWGTIRIAYELHGIGKRLEELARGIQNLKN